MAFDFSQKYKPEKPPAWKDSGVRLNQFYVKEGEMRRAILLTNEDPLYVGYIHNLFALSKAKGLGLKATEFAICPVNNDLPEYKGKRCPLCDAKGKDGKNLSFAKKVVMFPLLDLGQVVDTDNAEESEVVGQEWNGKTYQFQLRYAFLSFPTTKSAGSMSVVQKLLKKHKNNLRGLVVNISRDAQADYSVGNTWEVLEGEAGRIQLPVPEAEQATVIKSYIRRYPEVYGTISDEDNRFKYLTMKYPTVSDLPLHSPTALAARYNLTEGEKPAPAENEEETSVDGDEDIPF